MHARFNEIRLSLYLSISLSGETDLGPEESSAATTKYAYFNGFQPVALMGVYEYTCAVICRHFDTIMCVSSVMVLM